MKNVRNKKKQRPSSVGMSKTMTLIFAVTSGISVANIYYAQPLLDLIAKDFKISPAAIGLVITITQIGYGVGLIFIVPLGDLLERRRLIISQGILSLIALVAVFTARTETVLFISFVTMGILAVLAQILVALAASLSTPSARGKVVGMVTSGIVIGILIARFVAGVLADFGGWRAVYLTSFILTAALIGALSRILPRNFATEGTESYGMILRSIPTLFWHDSVLLIRSILALLIFAAFSTFWTALVLPLSSPPFDYSHTHIGLFGLVGLAGAVSATGAGRFADLGFGQWTTGSSLVILLGSWGLIAFLQESVIALIMGVVLLDLAVQAVHVTNQSIIFDRHPAKRSRLVGGYMVFYSVGSALGAISGSMAYSYAGWLCVCLVGGIFSATALLFWIITRHIPVERDSNLTTRAISIKENIEE